MGMGEGKKVQRRPVWQREEVGEQTQGEESSKGPKRGREEGEGSLGNKSQEGSLSRKSPYSQCWTSWSSWAHF